MASWLFRCGSGADCTPLVSDSDHSDSEEVGNDEEVKSSLVEKAAKGGDQDGITNISEGGEESGDNDGNDGSQDEGGCRDGDDSSQDEDDDDDDDDSSYDGDADGSTSISVENTKFRRGRTMEVNYDEAVPPLFAYMQNRQWDRVVQEAQKDPEQAQYWVYRFRRDDRSKVRWRLLPCHAAVIFRCPPRALRAVVECYPEGCSKVDDRGQLPIHLACYNRLAVRDKETLEIIVNAYPMGMTMKDGHGRTAMDFLSKARRDENSSYHEGESSFDAINRSI